MTIDLEQAGYRRATSAGPWVRGDAAASSFDYNDGDEFETWVEQTIRGATDVSTISREIEHGIRDWPSRYHLSQLRANLVQPLLGTIRGPVLEIGAGMGAVTRAIGEHGHEVVAIEGSLRRAAVCADRCRDLNNVQVVADTVQGFNTTEKFATVVVVGVLEYSRVFGSSSDGVDPVDSMLERVASLIAPGGQLILAIENQLGLKYFAGFPEDHVGRRMFGIEDRYGPDTVVTFGREELRRRLDRVGLGHQDWYFPFPDYKLPTAVISERALDAGCGFDPSPLVAPSSRADHQRPGVTSFELERAWNVVVRNGMLADLANSFLVRASSTDLTTTPAALAWYFGATSRRPEFAKTTSFEPTADGIVVKRRRKVDTLPLAVGGVRLELSDERYHRGQLWTHRLSELVGRVGWDVNGLGEWFETWFGKFCGDAIAEGVAVAGGTAVAGNMLDALPRNLLVDGDSAEFIDLEWSSTDDISLSYVVFRALFDSLASLGPVAAPADGTPLRLRELMSQVAARQGLVLDGPALAVHWERERTFQSTVLGSPVTVSAEEALDTSLELRRDLAAVIGDADVLARALSELGELKGRAVEWSAAESTLRDEIDRRGVALTSAHEREAAAGSEIERMVQALASAHEREAALGSEIQRAQTQHMELARETGRLEARTLRLASDLEDERQRADLSETTTTALRNELGAVRSTVSWRVTRPLRVARTLPHRMHRAGPPEVREVAEPEPEVDEDFDVQYYRSSNDDLRSFDDETLRKHYAENGRREGRRGRSILSTSRTVVRSHEASLETVLVVFHEATRTGAPVLGWNLLQELGKQYNVVAVLLAGGELTAAIEGVASTTVALDTSAPWTVCEMGLLADELATRYSPVYAIANSAATHALAPALERSGIPVVGLVHEFASSMRPGGVLAAFHATVSELVFPAEIVAESMQGEYADLLARNYRVIAQGQSLLPPGTVDAIAERATPRGSDGVELDLPERSLGAFLNDLDPATVLVVGAGTVSPRKGIEFFVQAASQSGRMAPDTPIAFAWIGHRIESLQWYVDELHQQVARSGVGDRVTFIGPVPDLGPLYERSDVFFLSSRLDPLPNVTIDAALAGVPVVAFEGASGFAEWLSANDALRELVVPHLDATAAADLIVTLAQHADARDHYGSLLSSAARASFDTVRYAAKLDELGRSARASLARAGEDVAIIAASGRFSTELYAGPGTTGDSLTLANEYVHRSRLAVPRARPRTGLIVRRPTEGFHPLAYAEQAPDYDDTRDGDPFADFLRKGEPDGPWRREIIRPGIGIVGPASREPQRVLVHGHFHYPELVDDVLSRISLNSQPVDVLLTTTSDDSARHLTRSLEESGLTGWRVEVVPNHGRNLAPLFTGLGLEVVEEYDLILHLHGKKSPHVDAPFADRWREFLWENLIGGRARMLDDICDAFARDPALGLVSPEDPHLNDWDLNRDVGEKLAHRLGIMSPLSNHFDFPLGAMFWARTDAIRPLFEARLGWEEYPAEPLPIDGTMLHALERLIPFAVSERGYTYAKTVVPGVTR